MALSHLRVIHGAKGNGTWLSHLIGPLAWAAS